VKLKRRLKDDDESNHYRDRETPWPVSQPSSDIFTLLGYFYPAGG